MRADATTAAADAARWQLASTIRGRLFTRSLARARRAAAGAAPATLLSGPSAAVRLRSELERAGEFLRERRHEARGRDTPLQLSTSAGTLDAERPARVGLVPASALDRLVLESGRMTAGAFLDLDFGQGLRVRLVSGLQGVELTLRPDAGLEGVARRELPGLVAALRARGVVLARAGVASERTGRRSPGGARTPGGGALTATRASGRNAPSSPSGGTVAKW